MRQGAQWVGTYGLVVGWHIETNAWAAVLAVLY